MPKSDDRFYLMEFRNRPVMYGDIGSLLRIQGLVVGGGGTFAFLLLPGTDLPTVGNTYMLTEEEWSDYIRRSDDPEILVGTPKVFQRKIRWEISGAIQQKVWAADGFACMYCQRKMGKVLLTIDHFVPLELGGVNDVTNFLTACKPCNKDKGSQHPSEWLELERSFRTLTFIQYREYLKGRNIS
jgi:hypothetical protein